MGGDNGNLPILFDLMFDEQLGVVPVSSVTLGIHSFMVSFVNNDAV
jgi:hypothetical protein